MDAFPPDTEEKKKIAGAFRERTGDVETNVKKLGEVVGEAKGVYGSVEGWGCYGLCWGGKVAALSSGPGTAFKAAGTAHPGYSRILDLGEIESV